MLFRSHFHYTIMGGLIFAFFAGIYYWPPKMTGIKLNDRGLFAYPRPALNFCEFRRRIASRECGIAHRVVHMNISMLELRAWVSLTAWT